MNKIKALHVLNLNGSESPIEMKKAFIKLHNDLVNERAASESSSQKDELKKSIQEVRQAAEVLGLTDGMKKVPLTPITESSPHLFTPNSIPNPIGDPFSMSSEIIDTNPTTKGIRKFLNSLTHIEEGAAALSFGILALLMLADVLSREILGQSLHVAQKLSLNLMLWAGFLGATIVANKGGHLRPEIADKIWPKSVFPIIKTIEQFLIALFCFGMTYFSIQFLLESYSMGDRSNVTNIPNWVVQLIFPYTFFSMGFRYILYGFFPSVRPQDMNEATEALKMAEEDLHIKVSGGSK